MKQKKDRFVVWVHTRPFVKKYLLRNFRVRDARWKELVNVSVDGELAMFVRINLSKPTHRYDKRLEDRGRGERVAIEIGKDDFYRHGWAFSPTDEHRFNALLETRLQTMAKVFLSASYMLTGNLAESIRRFYKVFGFTEDDWSVDTLRKMWLRDKLLPKIDLSEDIFKKNTVFLLAQLSKHGTITEEGRMAYEKNVLGL